MNTAIKYILFFIPIFLVVSCESTKVITTGQQRPAIPVEQVKIYDAPPFNSQPIGFLMAESGGSSQGSINDAIQKLKRKAASLGANGVVVGDVNTSTVWINYWPVDDTYVSGKAFYIENSVAKLQQPASATELQQATDADKKVARDLIGHWESVAFKGKSLVTGGVEKMVIDFLPDNQLTGTAIQNGQTNVLKFLYTIRGDNLLFIDTDPPPDSMHYSLVGDHLILTGGRIDSEIIFQKVQKNTP